MLFLLDEVLDPAITIKVLGHQWYWGYEYSHFYRSFRFHSYMIISDDIESGDWRLLEVDKALLIPIRTPIRLIVRATDVIHS